MIDPERTGIPGGEFPYWVSIKGDDLAYVSSLRDREIDVVKIANAPSVLARIPVRGNPNRSVLNGDQSLLFVAQDNSDSVAVIRTASTSRTSQDNISGRAATLCRRWGVTRRQFANISETKRFRDKRLDQLKMWK